MRVLVACEYSGRVREAFRKLGHDVTSCDLIESEDDSPHHIIGDAIELAYSQQWDLMIAHPPCTYLTNSGVCWLHKDSTRWAKLDEGAEFFKRLWHAPIARKALENPIMHKYARERVGIEKTQVIQPWMFGHPEQKATCLFLDGLPALVQTNNVKAQMMLLPDKERQRLHYASPGPDRWKERSRTFQGIADAMAAQWGAIELRAAA